MGNILKMPNGKSLVLTHRSASTSFTKCAIDCYWPNTIMIDDIHPAVFLPAQEFYDGSQSNTCIIVRNPIDRFVSMLKHKSDYNIDYWLSRPPQPLPTGHFDKYFLFETQLQDCAKWLGLYKPLEICNQSYGSITPLSVDELDKIHYIYSKDIELWRSLQE
jgi:hypothetical protein